MDNKKHTGSTARRHPGKTAALLLSAVVLLGVTAARTGAFVAEKPEGAVTNTFERSSVTCEVTETFEDNVKSDVQIKNTGDVDAYMRATIVVTWQDADHNLYWQTPVLDTEYTMTIAEDTGWFLGSDGYYYYENPVAVGASTGVLISECKPIAAAPAEDYTLVVEILAEAIQADGVNSESAAVAGTVWPAVTVGNSGVLSAVNG